MKVKFHVTNKNIDYVGTEQYGTVVGTYSRQKNMLEMSLYQIWRYNRDIDKFIFAFSRELTHEYLHKEIWEELETQQIDIQKFKYPVSGHEWIVKKLNNEKLNEFSLVPYLFRDFQWKIMNTRPITILVRDIKSLIILLSIIFILNLILAISMTLIIWR